MEFLTDPTVWVGLFTLTLLEIVLGVDNLIFIAILAGCGKSSISYEFVYSG